MRFDVCLRRREVKLRNERHIHFKWIALQKVNSNLLMCSINKLHQSEFCDSFSFFVLLWLRQYLFREWKASARCSRSIKRIRGHTRSGGYIVDQGYLSNRQVHKNNQIYRLVMISNLLKNQKRVFIISSDFKPFNTPCCVDPFSQSSMCSICLKLLV